MFSSTTAVAVIAATLLVGSDAAVTYAIVDEATDETAVDWGPLAVVSTGSAPDAGLGPGTLSVGAACVTFKADDARPGDAGITLVWPADRTRWRPDDRQVVFAHPVHGATRFSDGDRVLFVGQALPSDSPDGPEDVAVLLDEAWAQWPDPSCPTAMWHVGDVRRPSAGGINATSDLRAGAKADGWTVEEAKLQQKASRAVGRVSTAIYRQQGDIWIGSALSRDPGGAPSLYIKGPAPQFVRDLVAEADYLIAIVDEQPYSFDELEERSTRVHQALVEAGYPNVSTGTNITGGGVIPSWLLQVGDLPAERAEILEFVPEDLRADVDLHVTIAPPRPSAEPGTWGPLAVLYRPQRLRCRGRSRHRDAPHRRGVRLDRGRAIGLGRDPCLGGQPRRLATGQPPHRVHRWQGQDREPLRR